MKPPVFILLLFAALSTTAQKTSGFVSGIVVDENENRLAGVSITILGKQNGIISSDSGTYRINVPAGKAFALAFSHAGFGKAYTLR